MDIKQTLFDVNDIPRETQLRDIVDEVGSEEFRPIFKVYFYRLQRGKHLFQYQFLDGLYLCSIDGTQYFHSQSINCSGCLTSKHKNGDVSYSHKVLQAAIMHPEMRQVIPLMPEEIRNTYGTIKQDCEINVAKRLIPAINNENPKLNLIIYGNELFTRGISITYVMVA